MSIVNQLAVEQYKDVMIDATWNRGHAIEASTIEMFYKIENRFLDYLFDFKKEKAQNEAAKLVDTMRELVAKGQYPSVKHYLLGLVGIISEKMQKLRTPVEKVFSFSATSIELIEEKLRNGNATDVINEMIVFFTYKIEEKEQPNLLHQTVNEVIQYIDNEVLSPLSVEGLAKRFNVSTSHLSRIFREYSGITLVEYINIKKVEESQYYLRFSGDKISDISDNFHFCNQSYFTRIFKKYTGLTPRKFKNDLQGSYFHFHLQQEK